MHFSFDWLYKHQKVILAIFCFLLMILAGGYALLEMTGLILLNTSLTYCALATLPFTSAFFFFGLYQYRLRSRRAIEQDELQCLYSEAAKYQLVHHAPPQPPPANQALPQLAPDVQPPPPALAHVLQEVLRLQNKQEPQTELDALPLRQALVDLYSTQDLIAKAKYDLTLLKEYMEEDDPDYQALKKQIEEPNINKEPLNDTAAAQFRADVKILREKIAWYDKTWAQGELILKGVLYWATVTIAAALLGGLLPIVNSEETKVLGILNWGAFGVAGALLGALVKIRDMDAPEVGETEGKQLLLTTGLSTSIGAVVAILLYAALAGELLAGKVFPQIHRTVEAEDYWKDTGLCIFWAVFAGFSVKIFIGLLRLAEGGFAKGERE